jgi:plastocyanin
MNGLASRRDFLRLAGLGGGVVFASALRGNGALGVPPADDFHFVQLSDTHWGYEGPANPAARDTLPLAVQAVNALEEKPDFAVFTGDLTHTTDDPAKRRERMKQFREIVGKLRVRTVRFMPGEHDASLDRGEAYQELFGETHGAFDHKGIHFVVLDNVSDPAARVGEGQIAWLKKNLAGRPVDAPIVVLTHRPLFDLAPDWDWATQDGAEVLAVLMPFRHVTVFYGHIHQEHHMMTGHIAHHAARSLIFPLPTPGSAQKRSPVPWDPVQPYRGLGFRDVEAYPAAATYRLGEKPVIAAATTSTAVEAPAIRIVAKKFSFTPAEVRVKKGVPVVLELVSEDRVHGFNLPAFGLRRDVKPGEVTRVTITPEKAGIFPFHCDVFCGDGHDEMNGVLVVTE